MELDNIITICIPLIIGIMTIAYPILGEKKNKIGEKYNAVYLLNIFESFGPQKKIKFLKLSYFEFSLLVTIASFIFLILQLPPFSFFKDSSFYFLLEHSADLLTLILSSITFCLFIVWTYNIMYYTGKTTEILTKLFSKFNVLKSKNVKQELTTYYLKSINSIALYAIKKGEVHLQESLLQFYYNLFKKERKNKNPVEFTNDLYWFIFNVINESLTVKNQRLNALEHRAISGKWIFGEGSEEPQISEITYQWLWRYIVLISDNKRMLTQFWASSHQVCYFQMKIPNPKYSLSNNAIEIINEYEINEAKKRKEKFLEMFIALGGLELHKKNYAILNYMFTYTQSQPAHYVLLPERMEEVFEWFSHFLNDYETLNTSVQYIYWFPEFDNIGNSHNVKNEICKYIALLFIRQFTLQERYTFDDYINYTITETKISKLHYLQQHIDYFEKLVLENLQNNKLMKCLHFDINHNLIKKTISNIKENIEDKISELKLNTELSTIKIENFKNSTKEIIGNALKKFEIISNNNPIPIHDIDLDISTKIEGTTSLFSKSAFIDDEIDHLNYDTILAEELVLTRIDYFLPKSFRIASTKKYIIGSDLLIQAINKLIPDKANKVIIGFGIDNQNERILKKSGFNEIFILLPCSDRSLNNTFFILNKDDLPRFKFKIPTKALQAKFEGIFQDFKFERLIDSVNLYVSILDYNKPLFNDVKKYYNIPNSDDLQILVYILFECIIEWKNTRSIIQLALISPFIDRGISNTITDIKRI
ncbi:hypothetical protein [Myroides odoratimimus]|uniref:hypothetical protein n=1 Tax=Myroides odoratimimus TaxID=76832 RepID=UPI0025776EA8|nr:hypothetical protein [Myroides odoratimimus]MDM1465263.1 hypothetical protein [Myroides odoratimimus]MDM1475267.1 hypothetical protein [Myroides odoratimimus]